MKRYCSHCGQEIEPGEAHYSDGESVHLHLECLIGWTADLGETTLADILGFEKKALGGVP